MFSYSWELFIVDNVSPRGHLLEAIQWLRKGCPFLCTLFTQNAWSAYNSKRFDGTDERGFLFKKTRLAVHLVALGYPSKIY